MVFLFDPRDGCPKVRPRGLHQRVVDKTPDMVKSLALLRCWQHTRTASPKLESGISFWYFKSWKSSRCMKAHSMMCIFGNQDQLDVALVKEVQVFLGHVGARGVSAEAFWSTKSLDPLFFKNLGTLSSSSSVSRSKWALISYLEKARSIASTRDLAPSAFHLTWKKSASSNSLKWLACGKEAGFASFPGVCCWQTPH